MLKKNLFIPPEAVREMPEKEAHKVFDQAIIIAEGGQGGKGERAVPGKGRTVRNFKCKPGNNQPRWLFLPASEPANGEMGGDVVLYVDPQYTSLVHLHERSEYRAKNGANGNPAVGSLGPMKSTYRTDGASAPPLMIPVPPGTCVKNKKAFLGELLTAGDQLVVARGGRGGLGVTMPQKGYKKQLQQEAHQLAERGIESEVLDDEGWLTDSEGKGGERVKLTLTLRVKADVGIIGLPNAGKSSLLRAITAAAPKVASYPFTTLTPNLGILTHTGSEATKHLVDAVLADMPGLIQDAHRGKGLGRMFLRHLKRTRVILHVVDASLEDPGGDYAVVRRELRLYNPEYCQRPHVVVLNKMDMPQAFHEREQVAAMVMRTAQELQAEHEVMALPESIIFTSATTLLGVEAISMVLQPLLQRMREEERRQERRIRPVQLVRPLRENLDRVKANHRGYEDDVEYMDDLRGQVQ